MINGDMYRVYRSLNLRKMTQSAYAISKTVVLQSLKMAPSALHGPDRGYSLFDYGANNPNYVSLRRRNFF
jgi:hypothetical protein